MKYMIMIICLFALSACGDINGETKVKQKENLENEVLLKLNSGPRGKANEK